MLNFDRTVTWKYFHVVRLVNEISYGNNSLQLLFSLKYFLTKLYGKDIQKKDVRHGIVSLSIIR